MNQNSPSPESIKSGKYEIMGILQGLWQQIKSGETTKSIKDSIGVLKDKVFDTIGLSGEGFDLTSLLGIDVNDLVLGVNPVLDTSSFDSDYSRFLSEYGLGDTSGYNFGTSSSLANDISGSTYGTNGFYTGAAVDNSELTASVQDIAERMTRLEVRMDTGALVGALYAGIDEKLGEKQILAGRGVYA